MTNYIRVFASILLPLLLVGCGNPHAEMSKLVEERDSLRTASEYQAAKLEGYAHLIEVINSTLDSIAHQESMIFIGNGEMPATKEDVKLNLDRFEDVLNRQKDKIDELEELVNALNASNANALSLISHLREQINAKDKHIAQLKKEVEKKNVDISRLKEQVESQQLTIDAQKATITELDKRTKKQGEALARQDAILNNGYVLIGTREDLKRKGVITRKGEIVSDAVLDRSKFAKVDIRQWKEVCFTAKRPRILTDMPKSSYEMTTAGDRNFTLTIKNPSDFWQISYFLIIQTD